MSPPSPKRPVTVIIGVVFSLLIGGLALLLAATGLMGRGGQADIVSGWPNLITGIASIIGAMGYLALKKWAIPVYVVAVVGHLVSHTLLFVSHSASGRVTLGGIVFLLLVPAMALLVMIDMLRQQRRGVLS
jgi:hypothetical protein